MRVMVVISAIILMVVVGSALWSNSSDKGTSVSGQAAEAPCEAYKNFHTQERFVVLECLNADEEHNWEHGAAYLYDPTRKKCFFLAGTGTWVTLTNVTCDNLPVPN